MATVPPQPRRPAGPLPPNRTENPWPRPPIHGDNLSGLIPDGSRNIGADDPMTYVSGNNFPRHVEGDPRKSVSP